MSKPAIAGPVTVSGQHQAWLIPLLETGWVAYLSTTDAVCYHDGHRSLDAHRDGPIHEVPIWGDDGALRDDRTIRVTDMAFDEDVLLDQDRFLTAVLQRPEFQRWMCGPDDASEANASQMCRTACGVESRGDIDGNAEAEKTFREQIQRPWQKFCADRGITFCDK